MVAMKWNPALLGLAACTMVVAAAQDKPGKTLDIYFVDTEGGLSALYVSPSGESLLIDTGSPGARDVWNTGFAVAHRGEAVLNAVHERVILNFHVHFRLLSGRT